MPWLFDRAQNGLGQRTEGKGKANAQSQQSGRNRARTCDLFLVREALIPTELFALRSLLYADSV